jgi:hypothetical protein
VTLTNPDVPMSGSLSALGSRTCPGAESLLVGTCRPFSGVAKQWDGWSGGRNIAFPVSMRNDGVCNELLVWYSGKCPWIP